jgi:hypothetical protein
MFMNKRILGLLAASTLTIELLALLPGCSLVSESTRLSIEDAEMVQAGTIVQGDGYSVRVPEARFYLVRDRPMRGAVCLRMRGDWPGDSYNVLPLISSTSGLSLQEAWQAYIRQYWPRKLVKDYRILSEHTNVWQGSDAWFQTGYIPTYFLTANCVTRRGTNYYWIVHSIGLQEEEEATYFRTNAEQELQAFLDGISFDQIPRHSTGTDAD